MTRLALATVMLVAVYLLALGSSDPLDAAQGLVVAVVLVTALRRWVFASGPRTRSPALPARVAFFPVFAAVVLREVLLGTAQVAAVVLGVRRLLHPGIVALPIGERTDLGVAVTAHALTLSPGEALVDVDREGGRLFIHVIDASDPEGIRDRHERLYRRYQRRVFP